MEGGVCRQGETDGGCFGPGAVWCGHRWSVRVRRHYIVHTRYLPTSRLAKRIRMHHLLHHTRNEAYWLAFTVPQVRARGGRFGPWNARLASALTCVCVCVRARARACARVCTFFCCCQLPRTFMFPPCGAQVDQLFGTDPQPSSVHMSEMAKAGLRAGRGAR